MTSDEGLGIRWGQTDDAAVLVRKYHYAGRLPAAAYIRACATLHIRGGLFDEDGGGEPVAAVVFNIPAAQWKEEVWELGRLVKKPGFDFPLTRLIGLAMKGISKLTDLVISYADWTQNHHGGIYQAASWKYDGKRDPVEIGVIINGEKVHGRTANHRYGTRSRTKLAEFGIIAEPLMDDGKHLYWRALSRSGQAKAERLGLKQTAYPKPQEQPND